LPELWKRALAHAGIDAIGFDDAPPDGFVFYTADGSGRVLRRDWLDCRSLEMLAAE
jgi:hypothetical protein